MNSLSQIASSLDRKIVLNIVYIENTRGVEVVGPNVIFSKCVKLMKMSIVTLLNLPHIWSILLDFSSAPKPPPVAKAAI